MTIVRAPRPNSNFYILDKAISGDKMLTWAARGMLVFLLGKPDNWRVSVQALINETQMSRKQSGRDAVYGLIAELKEAGYLQALTSRSEGGAFGGVDYMVCEARLPLAENPEAVLPPGAPCRDLPDTAAPLAANPLLTRTEEKQELKQTKEALPPGFEVFWKQYPNKGSKLDAARAFRTVKAAEHGAIMAAVEVHKAGKKWLKDHGEYIPLAATWLRGRRWEDEMPTANAGDWWEGAQGIERKGAELGIKRLGDEPNERLRFAAQVWVAAGDGPHWDRDSAVYPLAVSLRKRLVPVPVQDLLDTLDLRMAAGPQALEEFDRKTIKVNK